MYGTKSSINRSLLSLTCISMYVCNARSGDTAVHKHPYFHLLLSLVVQKTTCGSKNYQNYGDRNTESHRPSAPPGRQSERGQSTFLSSYLQNKRETAFILLLL